MTTDDANASGANCIEVGADGHELHKYNFTGIYCSKHTMAFDADRYRRWFAESQTHGEEKDQDDVLIPIDVQRDPDPESKLKGLTYRLVHRHRGRLLIVNNINFDPGTKLETREGSIHDATNLDNLFTRLGFKVQTKEDQNAEDIKTLIEDEAQRGDHGDAFFLCILSHGTRDKIVGTDGSTVDIEENIMAPFAANRCKSLVGKPKVFLFQACQGNQEARNIRKDKGKDKGRGKGKGRAYRRLWI
jgi:hypothetical protein